MTYEIRRIAARLGMHMLVVVAASVLAGPAAAFSYYLNDGAKAVAAQGRTPVANPQPVQLIFQITKNGVAAPRRPGTAILEEKVLEAVKTTGVFSDVSEGPSANGATITVTLNSVSTDQEERDAKARGFVSGFTLGLAPGSATEHYVWTVDFVADASAPRISVTTPASLTVAVGLIQNPPPDTVKMPTYHDAIFAMIQDVVSNALADLAKDPRFQRPVAPAK